MSGARAGGALVQVWERERHGRLALSSSPPTSKRSVVLLERRRHRCNALAGEHSGYWAPALLASNSTPLMTPVM